MDKIEEKIIKIIENERNRIIDFANDIFQHGELGYKEFRTSEKFENILRDHVKKVENHLAITGVKGYLNPQKSDNFSVALLGELDALKTVSYTHLDVYKRQFFIFQIVRRHKFCQMSVACGSDNPIACLLYTSRCV